jgi:hypothetical protein
MEKESEIRYESRSNDWTEWSEEWLEEVVEGENEVTEDQTEDTFPPKELPKSELEVIQDASTFVGDKSLPHPSQPALLVGTTLSEASVLTKSFEECFGGRYSEI